MTKHAIIFSLFLVAPLFAQSGAVSGHVSDSTAAPIANALAEISSSATGGALRTRTNNDGYFLFPPLTPGAYVVRVSASGFAPATIDQVVIEVGTSRSLDMTLQPESQIQSVTVTAAAPEFVTDRSDRGNVIESQFVQNTPLNIRNPLQLVNFAQGLHHT